MDSLVKPANLMALALLLTSAVKENLHADEAILGEVFQPAGTGCEILWDREAGQLPESAPHYSAGAHRFSRNTIDYFKNLGSFTDKLKVPPLEHWGNNKDSERYAKGIVWLSIAPSLGSLTYYHPQSHEKAVLPDAPTSEVAKTMTRKMLAELDVDLASLSFEHVRFTKETATRFDRASGKTVSRLSNGGVFVPRIYEGAPSNNAGFTVQFGWGGEVTEFSICWRDVEPAERRKVPTREEIAKQILEGRATVMMDAAQNADKLMVRKISVIQREAEPFKKADTVEPYLLIKADAEVNGETADCTIYLKLQ